MTSHPQSLLDLRSVFGLQARITASAAATEGAYLELDCTLDPGGESGIHKHPGQEDLRGPGRTLEILADGTWQPVPARQRHAVPPGAGHGFRNTSPQPVRFLNVHRPAHGFQNHLETLDRLTRASKIKGPMDPRSLMYACQSMIVHRPAVSVKPPHWVVRFTAFLGRRLGYRLE